MLILQLREYATLHQGIISSLPHETARRDHVNEVIENSRIEIVLPKHGPTDGADSMPE